MEKLEFRFPSVRRVSGRSQIGVVASGDLEILMTALDGSESVVQIRTSVSSYAPIWEATLRRFCERNNAALLIEINDFGATPGMVLLRLQQALDTLGSAKKGEEESIA